MQSTPPLATLAAASILLASSLAHAGSPLESDYQNLRLGNAASTPVAVPEGGLQWTMDTAGWRLDSGRIWPLQPLADGHLPGLVFEGSGQWQIEIPDPVELRQLRRFTGEPKLERLTVQFDRLLLLSSEADPPLDLLAADSAAQPHRLAHERIEQWSKIRGYDAAARLLEAHAADARRYLRVEMETQRFGWLTYTWDDARPEEIGVGRFHSGSSFLESWLRLDRPGDRAENGRPTSVARPAIELRHLAVTGDLTHPGKWSGSVRAAFDVKVTVRALEPLRLVRFQLHPHAEIQQVVDEDGTELTVLRDRPEQRLAGRGASDSLAVVELARPMAVGEVRTVRFVYRLDMRKYGAGRSWYPHGGPAGTGLMDRHTAHLELTFRKDHELRAMGRQVELRPAGPVTTAVWEVDRPAKMVTFTFARRSREQPLEVDGLPRVIAFGEEAGTDTADAFHDIAADVANSLAFFEQLFDQELEAETLYATLIPGFHGQAFDGFLHLTELTARGDHPGATELFRAHEVAHQWWGHEIGWHSYRDQWLSEAFAEYSAMMFVEATVDNGDALFEEILAAYSNEVLGSSGQFFSKFARPGLARMNAAGRDQIGPIGLGLRANTHRAPAAYVSMSYTKGALVLHMLRGILAQISGGDEVFIRLLREFAASFRGRAASTADFQAVLERVAPGDWSWFFDQWVLGNEVPTYAWRASLPRAADAQGRWLVRLEVEQRDVPAGFRMPVPVRFHFGGDRVGQVAVMVDEPSETFEIPMPQKPRKVELNPSRAVLARTDKR